ncbi:MAG TPA: hypothetical protein VIA81_10380 [Acidimicrobiia bacterium]|jgi:hypothetical protein
MDTPPEVAKQAANWPHLTRWERAELGRRLRREGWTYGEIMDVLPVGKGTLSGWCREIRLSDKQIEAIKARRPPGVRTGIPVDTQRKRRGEIERIREEARTEALSLVGDTLWLAGVVLYWAEGCKGKNSLEMANTDPKALRFFIRWVRMYLDEQAEFNLQMHLHEGNDEASAMEYWVYETGLHDATFHRTFIKPRGTGHRKNHLPHGVCKVRVRRCADMWNRVMAWRDVVSEFLGPAISTIRVGR